MLCACCICIYILNVDALVSPHPQETREPDEGGWDV